MALILSGDTGVPASGMPTGSVIQTVSSYYNAGSSTTSTSFVATPLTATITPISSTSKILIFASMPVETASSGAQAYATIYRNGSNIAPSSVLSETRTGGGYIDVNLTINWLDSPASTSALTYTYYLQTASGTLYYGTNVYGIGTIILQEIHG